MDALPQEICRTVFVLLIFLGRGLVCGEPAYGGVFEMTEERITIVLRDGDKEEFEEIMKTMGVPKDISTKAGVVRRLMSFYKANSPLMREVE